mgnify:CR=1 FL=1
MELPSSGPLPVGLGGFSTTNNTIWRHLATLATLAGGPETPGADPEWTGAVNPGTAASMRLMMMTMMVTMATIWATMFVSVARALRAAFARGRPKEAKTGRRAEGVGGPDGETVHWLQADATHPSMSGTRQGTTSDGGQRMHVNNVYCTVVPPGVDPPAPAARGPLPPEAGGRRLCDTSDGRLPYGIPQEKDRQIIQFLYRFRRQ